MFFYYYYYYYLSYYLNSDHELSIILQTDQDW